MSVIYTGSWGSDEGLFRVEYSSNTTVWYSLHVLRDYTYLEVDPGDSNVLWGANWNGSIYKIDNPQGVPSVAAKYTGGNSVTCIKVDRSNSQKIVAATNYGILRSDDGGESFTWVCDALDSNAYGKGYNDIEQSTANSDEYYCGQWIGGPTPGGLYKYTFSTDTFAYLGLNGADIMEMTNDTLGRLWLLMRDGQVVYYDGSNFNNLGQPASITLSTDIQNVTCCPTQLLYTSHFSDKVYTSINGGITLSLDSTNLNMNVSQMAIDCDAAKVFAVGANGLWQRDLCK